MLDVRWCSVPRRTVAALAALLAVLAVLLAGSSWTTAAAAVPAAASLDPALSTSGQAAQRVVVSGLPGGLAAVRRAVERAGGRDLRELSIVDGFAASVPADRLPGLARDTAVTAVTLDRAAHLTGITNVSTELGQVASVFDLTSGATDAWRKGATGSGVGVAVLDTGVAPVDDLAGRVMSGPDLSGENKPAVDSYGHGTVMAGIVAGDGAAGGGPVAGIGRRAGVAPDARVVSVKVAGADGSTDVSTVLAAMNWVASFRDTYGIRVMNLSWGVPSTQDPRIDPLDHAVERLWQLGIVVVVAAGNNGPTSGTITKPGDDPLVVTVGAYDDRANLVDGDDAVTDWSGRGPTLQGLAKPDLVAPGRTLVATRSPGSTVEQDNPGALVAPAYIKGSGTSEATAVTSGAAALLLSARPQLTPDQVKALLTSTARPLAGTSRFAQGAGRLAVGAALAARLPKTPPQRAVATGTGSLDASRGSSPRVSVTCNGQSKVLDDETTSWCAPWDGSTWTGSTWTGSTWTGSTWTGSTWTGDAWASDAWTGSTWTGSTWTGSTWTGSTWTGSTWTGSTWTGSTWTGSTWTSAGYGSDDSFGNAFWGDQPQWWQDVPGEVSKRAPAWRLWFPAQGRER